MSNELAPLSPADYFAALAEGEPIDPLSVRVAIRVDAQGVVQPLDPAVVGVNSNRGLIVSTHALPPLRSLFRGDRKAFEDRRAPPDDLLTVFHTIEGTLAEWCVLSKTRVRDEQFAQLYSELRRRPDGRGGPLFQYARAAAQVALLLRPTSEAEFDAVLRRIERSTRTFSDGPMSTGYLERALLPLTSIGTVR